MLTSLTDLHHCTNAISFKNRESLRYRLYILIPNNNKVRHTQLVCIVMYLIIIGNILILNVWFLQNIFQCNWL